MASNIWLTILCSITISTFATVDGIVMKDLIEKLKEKSSKESNDVHSQPYAGEPQQVGSAPDMRLQVYKSSPFQEQNQFHYKAPKDEPHQYQSPQMQLQVYNGHQHDQHFSKGPKVAKQNESPTGDEQAFNELRLVGKELFVHKNDYSKDEVLKRLMVFYNYKNQQELSRLPLDHRLLIEFNRPMLEKCDDINYMQAMRSIYDRIEDGEYPSLKNYMHDVVKAQVALCDYPVRFKKSFEGFKAQNSGQWNLIKEFNKLYEDFGKRSSKYQDGDYLQNDIQINNVFNEMATNLWPNPGHEQSTNSYNLANHIREACVNFRTKLEPSLKLTELAPVKKWNKDKEIKNWGKYMNVCKQVANANFERTLGDMMGNAYMPLPNMAFKLYESYVRPDYA